LEEFKALMVLRYSATHKTTHNKIHRLDALDAYNQKLVKKIAVRGIAVKGWRAPGLPVPAIHRNFDEEAARGAGRVRAEAGGEIKRVVRKLGQGRQPLLDLFSNELDQYRHGYVVSDINANTDTLSFTNGVELTVGDATGDVNEAALRRIQIREAIKAHFDKEQALFQQGHQGADAVLHRRGGQVPRLRSQRPTRKASTRGSSKRNTAHLNEVLDLDETPTSST
jgi:type III restriction enzyme